MREEVLQTAKVTMYNNSRFVFNKKAREMLKIDVGSALMAFVMNKQNYICLRKEDDSDEFSFKVRSGDNGTVLFTNTAFKTRLVNFFDLRMEVSQAFDVAETRKGFKLTPVE